MSWGSGQDHWLNQPSTLGAGITGIGMQASSSDSSSSKKEGRWEKGDILKCREWILGDLKLLSKVEEEMAFGN